MRIFVGFNAATFDWAFVIYNFIHRDIS